MSRREEGDEGEEKNRSQPCGTLYRPRLYRLHFSGGSDSKESACNVGGLGLIPGSGRSPGEGNGNPLQYSGESHGRRSLVGYSPRGRRVRHD